jgi:hypothetical protein
MAKWITCGSVSNPKKAREYIRFYSKQDWESEQEAQQEAQRWQEENRYPFIWVEKVGK